MQNTVIDTPFLAVDLTRLDRNLAAMAVRANELGVELRPHAKTHKCIELARRQMDYGATGLTVATIGEAEVFAEASTDTGCADLFIAYPLWVTRHKGTRLRALAQRVSLRVGVDSVEGAHRLGAELGLDWPDITVEVLIEVDSGQHRTGVDPDDAGKVAVAAAQLGLDVVGVFTFPGHGYGPGHAREVAAAQESAALAQGAQSLRASGIDPRVRSGGSTPTTAFAEPGVLTEIRPGVYPFYDAQQIELGTCSFDDVALSAVATVVRRDNHRIVIDAGSKILGADRPAWASGYGRVLEEPSAVISSLSEHHAVIDFPADAEADEIPDLGTVVRVIPNHVCSAVNLVDELFTNGPEGATRWRVGARGRNW